MGSSALPICRSGLEEVTLCDVRYMLYGPQTGTDAGAPAMGNCKQMFKEPEVLWMKPFVQMAICGIRQSVAEQRGSLTATSVA